MLRRKDITDRVMRYGHSKEARGVAGNLTWLALLQVASYLFPLITVPYLARVIGVEGYGHIAFAAAVMVWIKTIAEWGFNMTGTRDLARHRNDPQMVSEIFSNVQYARCLMTAVSFGAICILVLAVPKFRNEAAVMFVTFLMVPGHILFPEWFFQGMERMKYVTLLNVLIKLLFTLSVFVFIRRKEDYLIQPLLTSCGYLVSGLIAQYIILRRWGVRLMRFRLNAVRRTIKDSTDVFLNNLMQNLYNSFSSVLLGLFGTPADNGMLDAGHKFVQVGQSLMGTVSRAFFPFLSRRIDKHTAYARLSLSAAGLIALCLIIAAPWLMRLFFIPEFYPATTVMRIMSVGIFFVVMSDVYGPGYMIVQGYERRLRNITAVVSIIGFVLAFPLIYYWGYLGTAINITLSRLLLGVSIMASALDMKRQKKNDKQA